MLTTSSPSPITFAATSPPFHRYDHSSYYRPSPHLSPKSQPRGPTFLVNPNAPAATPKSGQDKEARTIPASALQDPAPVRRMVDAGTQYSPPVDPLSRASLSSSTASPRERRTAPKSDVAAPSMSSRIPGAPASSKIGSKRSTPDFSTAKPIKRTTPTSPAVQAAAAADAAPEAPVPRSTPLPHVEDVPTAKRVRPDAPAVKLLPVNYEHCHTHDLVVLISSMLMELIRYNDTIPLRDGHLTRFHSRAAPTISVINYLQRLTTHATLSPPILLSMVYYIDRLCALYPAFTISSLTVHRFLITSATVASKGLSDSFWTNKTYARVGGVSLKELALLELEFLWRVEWRIVPRPEVLVDYYKSLVDRAENYEIDSSGRIDEELERAATAKEKEKEQQRVRETEGNDDTDQKQKDKG